MCGTLLPQYGIRPELAPVTTWGLGLSVVADGAQAHIGHGGSNYGFLCDAQLYPQSGKGAVAMINSIHGKALGKALEIIR